MTTYDLCLAWNVEEDSDFVRLQESACQAHNLSLLQVTSENIERIKEELDSNLIAFRSLLDRGSDNDPRFLALGIWATNHGSYVINKYDLSQKAADKAAMHFALINAGVQTPYTILLPAYSQQPELLPIELGLLGERFIIKPARGGGGEGVVKEAHSWETVLEARKAIPEDTYLLQVYIVARKIENRDAWFRIIHCSGELFLFWWDTGTHVYTPVRSDEEERLGLHPLREITNTISQICRLELFSTEVALTAKNLFVVVDYVNDQIDLRLQSQAADGIPDYAVEAISQRFALLVAANVPSS